MNERWKIVWGKLEERKEVGFFINTEERRGISGKVKILEAKRSAGRDYRLEKPAGHIGAERAGAVLDSTGISQWNGSCQSHGGPHKRTRSKV
ncbi:hypothetical protein AAC387_Pa02g0829 [Persea americana]